MVAAYLFNETKQVYRDSSNIFNIGTLTFYLSFETNFLVAFCLPSNITFCWAYRLPNDHKLITQRLKRQICFMNIRQHLLELIEVI